MIRPGSTFRSIKACGVCALTLSCALTAAATPQQDSAGSGKSTPAKSAPKKTTTSKSSHQPHPSATSSGAKKSSSKTTGKHSTRRKSSRARGQQKIDSQRALAIQQALIREHYLTGEPSSTWNQASEDAMRRYQADHGWQSKTVPDSRALISLGLGPSKDHLLNPDSAMTTVPDAPKSDPVASASHAPAPTAAPLPASSTPPTPSTPPPTESGSPQ